MAGYISLHDKDVRTAVSAQDIIEYLERTVKRVNDKIVPPKEIPKFVVIPDHYWFYVDKDHPSDKYLKPHYAVKALGYLRSLVHDYELHQCAIHIYGAFIYGDKLGTIRLTNNKMGIQSVKVEIEEPEGDVVIMTTHTGVVVTAGRTTHVLRELKRVYEGGGVAWLPKDAARPPMHAKTCFQEIGNMVTRYLVGKGWDESEAHITAFSEYIDKQFSCWRRKGLGSDTNQLLSAAWNYARFYEVNAENDGVDKQEAFERIQSYLAPQIDSLVK